MLGVFAEFETNLRRERQLEGIQKAKQKGVYKGRAPLRDTVKRQAIELHEQGLKPSEILKRLSIGRTSLFKILNDYKSENKTQKA